MRQRPNKVEARERPNKVEARERPNKVEARERPNKVEVRHVVGGLTCITLGRMVLSKWSSSVGCEKSCLYCTSSS